MTRSTTSGWTNAASRNLRSALRRPKPDIPALIAHVTCEMTRRTIVIHHGLPGRSPSLGLGLIIFGGSVDFIPRHSAGDVAHLLADVVMARAEGKCLELRLDVD